MKLMMMTAVAAFALCVPATVHADDDDSQATQVQIDQLQSEIDSLQDQLNADEDQIDADQQTEHAAGRDHERHDDRHAEKHEHHDKRKGH
jgi:TolA-binding protein